MIMLGVLVVFLYLDYIVFREFWRSVRGWK
jgi:hypothetical protein